LSRFHLSTDDCEILIARELRRAGIEVGGLRCRQGSLTASDDGWRCELTGTLEAYGHRWSALVACHNTTGVLSAAHVEHAHRCATAARARSTFVVTTGAFDQEAIARGHELRVGLLEIVDAQPVLLEAGLIQPGPLPTWVPEFTVQLVSCVEGRVRRRLPGANEPELILRELRPLT
jgi:hypothetical protein